MLLGAVLEVLEGIEVAEHSNIKLRGGEGFVFRSLDSNGDVKVLCGDVKHTLWAEDVVMLRVVRRLVAPAMGKQRLVVCWAMQ